MTHGLRVDIVLHSTNQQGELSPRNTAL